MAVKGTVDGWLRRLEAQLDLEPLMEGCCRALLELTGADRCSIMVLDSDTEQLVVRWAHGSRVKLTKKGGLKFRMGEGLCGWVARSQKAFCSVDASREPRFMPTAPPGRKFRPVKAICCLPLVTEGRTVGVVNLSSFKPSRRFRWTQTGAAKRFLDRLARVIAQTTQLREAEAVTQRLRRQAKATSETVAQVSHEVRTPLALINEAAQQMLDGLAGTLSTDQEQLARLIKSQGDRMLKLVTELLDLSRIESGRLALAREPLDPAAVIREVQSRYALLVSPRKLVLELEPVPPVYGDRSRLAQVVENLITNAVKFTPSDGTITVRLKARGRCAELTVADTGIGISPKEQRRLFEKFSQLRVPASMNTRGTGLGLTIVKEVVQLHGGSVRVESAQGKGASFIVSFPVYSPSFALTEEFRVMREQAAREGQVLAVQTLQAREGKTAPMDRIAGLLKQQVSRQDRILENPSGGIVILSVLEEKGLEAMRRRIQETLANPPGMPGIADLAFGWALVPREETTLPGVLALARRRACGEEAARV